jgi:hypothetical protein
MASSPSCSFELPLPHDCACSCSSELPHSRDCASPWPPPRCRFRAGIRCRSSSRPSPPSLGTSSSPRTPAVVWTSLGPLHRWVPGPTTRWAPGTTRLALHGTWRRGAQGLHRSSTRLGLCTCSALYRGLLDVLD